MTFTPSDAVRNMAAAQYREAHGTEGYIRLSESHFLLQHPTDFDAAFTAWNLAQAMSAWRCNDWIPSMNPKWSYPIVISFVTGDLSKDGAHFTVIELGVLQQGLNSYYSTVPLNRRTL